jgi:tetratricopeptide (TPR) repeat protein
MAVFAGSWHAIGENAPEFGAAREYDHGGVPMVVTHFEPHDLAIEILPGWERTSGLWLSLPEHPNVLRAVARCSGRLAMSRGRIEGAVTSSADAVLGAATRDSASAIEVTEPRSNTPMTALLLRFAAIDTILAEPYGDTDDRRKIDDFATWGLQLVDVAGVIARHVLRSEWHWLMNPLITLDRERQVRVGFLPVTHAATPVVDERHLVRFVGSSLERLWRCRKRGSSTRLGRVVARSVHARPRKRFATLSELRSALVRAGAYADTTRDGEVLEVWNLVERGYGRLALHDHAGALACFEQALAIDGTCTQAIYGRSEATDTRPSRSVVPWTPPPDEPPPPLLPWSTTRDEGQRFESEHRFREALRLYWQVEPASPDEVVALHLAISRCYVALTEWDQVVQSARKVVAIDPAHHEASSMIVHALVVMKRPHDALPITDAFVRAAPASGRAHYLRGRCQYALRQLHEARESFDRACTLEPTLVEALLLRREVDRSLGHVRATVGSQPAVMAIVPDRLAEIRPMLADGRVREAIALLRREAYRDDALAQMVLAGCLHHIRDLYNALTVYLRVEDVFPEYRHDAMLGRARVMTDLGRPDEAIALVDLASSTPA